MTKRNSIQLGLLLFAMWPIAQMQLARQYGVSSWKLGGWGMYATPRIDRVDLQVYARRRDQVSLVLVPKIPKELHLATWRFLDSYRWLGTLASPADLAREVLSFYPDVVQLRLVVHHPVVDLESAMVVNTEAAFDYSR